MFIQTRNKRAVSIMIGYILLITFAVVIAGVVFQWLKTYVPKEGIDCPDGVSLYILESKLVGDDLVLTLRNNGKFSVGGIFIYYSTDASQEIATGDLFQIVREIGGIRKSTPPTIKLGYSGETLTDNLFTPTDEINVTFDVSSLVGQTIYAIEMTPIRWQEKKNKIQTVSCTNAKTKKIIDLELVLNGPIPEGGPPVL